MIGDLFDTSAANRHTEFQAQSREAIVLANIATCLRAVRQRKQQTHERRLREEAQGELREGLPRVVGTLASIMEMYDRDTADHQVRVATIACAIAGEMGWDEEQLQALRVASLLHDVGKMTVSQEILNKPGRLNAEEFLQVKLHATAGHAILKHIRFSWPIAETVLQHHERMDGSGYPRGLRGNGILPMARALAIADVFDAMTTVRSYRPALELEVVLAELEAQAGTLLDARMVETCVSLFREKQCEPLCWNVTGDVQRTIPNRLAIIVANQPPLRLASL
ncbi:MAG: HD-GYP domain-containing protein [Terracidiphilus sp.]|nr:HD-GYP domain-containing protein [Terracidiphilus sp.]MDR3797472.1 HD-GYP domain-containing protein [Terracidiphilus sp.]